MSNQKSSGFTLIELLVVVLVISALSGILLGVINSSGIRAKARDSQRITDLKRIQTALELYFADNRAYPNSGTGNWEQIDGTSNIETALDPAYMDPMPSDPSKESVSEADPCGTETAHRYNYKSNGSTYLLTAIMEITTSKDDSPCSSMAHGCGTLATTDYCYAVQNP